MEESAEPLVHTCHTCGTLIDINDQEPLTLVHCPSCGTGQRVRTKFDHFEIQEVLGAGGMGAVYRAWDTTLNRPVALKLLRKEFGSDPAFVAQFQREAAITAQMNHPHIVKVYSTGNDHGLLYIAMELVDKGSLDDLMTLQGRVAEAQVLEIGAQIARGLDAALQRGLIHRDVKPGNILFTDAHSAKIVDFGLATLQEHAGKVGGEVWGTPYYVAPEKLDTPPREDFRSDLYSLGATLFHALAGRPPFEAETASMVALKHLKSQAVSLQAFAPDVSSATAFVVNKALSKEPADRYQSYTELAEHLDYARAQLTKAGAGASHKRARVRMESADDARTMSWITFAMIAIVVMGGVGAWVMRDKLFGKRQMQVTPEMLAQRKVRAEQEQRFAATRAVLVRGEFAKAATGFAAFAEEPDVPKPLLNWLTVHEGLAHLFAGDEKTARRVFSRLEARPPTGRGAVERKQSEFFINLGKTLQAARPIPSDAAQYYDKTNYECVALLLAGLKDWMLGDYDEGGRLLRQFQSSTPDGTAPWLIDYKELLTPFLDEVTVFRSVAELLKETDLAKARTQLDKLKAARAKLKVNATLREQVDAVITRIEKESEAADMAAKEQVAKAEAEDEAKLADARAKGTALLGQLKFAEAYAIGEAAKPATDKTRKAHGILMQRLDALVKFKAQLVKDLGSPGYTGPLVRVTGVAIPPGTLTGSDADLSIRSQFGLIPLNWTDLSMDSLITIAQSFIKPGLPPEEAGERQWLLGNFALVMGRGAVAQQALNAAAAAKPEYKDAVATLLAPPPPAEKKE
ncbi:MAG: protein kinase [Chthoniobacteraceae bacterium]